MGPIKRETRNFTLRMGQAMSDQKTKPTGASVDGFLSAIEPERRRQDAAALAEIMARITGRAPVMWGPSIVGYGKYHYTYDSGHSGFSFMTGFSPRKKNLVVYIMPSLTGHEALLAQLGKYKTGVCCLYINKLADVDLGVLEKLIHAGFNRMVRKYGRSPERYSSPSDERKRLAKMTP